MGPAGAAEPRPCMLLCPSLPPRSIPHPARRPMLPHAAASLSLAWEASFRRMRASLAAQQLALLQALGWRLRLDFVAGERWDEGGWLQLRMSTGRLAPGRRICQRL